MSFEKICNILKTRRIADEFEIQQTRIEKIQKKDRTIDELENNKSLQAKLEENRQIFNKKYTEVNNLKIQFRILFLNTTSLLNRM